MYIYDVTSWFVCVAIQIIIENVQSLCVWQKMYKLLIYIPLVPDSPTISMNPPTTATSITISWSIDSVVDSYEVMWSSEECPNDVDEGDTIITDGSTSYTIDNLREGTNYNITVTATNAAGTSLPSEQVTIQTTGIGK